MKIKIILMLSVISFFLSGINNLYTNEKDLSKMSAEEKKQYYLSEMLSYEIREEFDQRYPLNIKNFYFYKGAKEITYDEFKTIAGDTLLKKYEEKLKTVRVGGFTTAIVFGVLSVAFLIPGVIFIARQTNYNPIDTAYTFSGVAMIILTAVSLTGVLVSLIVTFCLIYKYKYSEYPVRKATEDYNEKLQKKLGLIPDISYNYDDKEIGIAFKIKI